VAEWLAVSKRVSVASAVLSKTSIWTI